jgi:zinc protease
MKQHWLFFHILGLLVFLGWPSPGWAFHTWKRVQLPNGLTLLVVEKPGMPVVSLTLLIERGATSDPPDKSGLATLTGHLLTEGTRQRAGEQIDQRIAALGGEFTEDVNFDYTAFDWAVLKEDLAAALELLADVVRHPSFPPAEVERARMAAIAKRQAKTEDTPEALVMRHFFAPGLYGRSPSGEVTALQRIAREHVVQFHHQMYRPEATVLAAAGDLTLEELETLAKKYFADWPAPEKTQETLPVVLVRKEPAVLVINRPLVQASVRLVFVGAPAASPAVPALLLLSQLLGGGADSRLGANLREQKRWAYSVRSTAEPFWQTGLFYVDLSVPYEVIVPALQEIVREIIRLQTEPVSSVELAQAKQELTTHFYFETENVRDLSRFVAEHEASTHGREPPDHAIEALRSVTADEVQRVARTYLDPQWVVVTVEGDPQAIGKYAPTLAQGRLPRWSPPSEAGSQQRDGIQSTWVTPGEISGAKEGRIQ